MRRVTCGRQLVRVVEQWAEDCVMFEQGVRGLLWASSQLGCACSCDQGSLHTDEWYTVIVLLVLWLMAMVGAGNI